MLHVLMVVFIVCYVWSFYLMGKHSYRKGYFSATYDWIDTSPFPTWLERDLQTNFARLRLVLHAGVGDDSHTITLDGPIPGWEEVDPKEVTLSDKAQQVGGRWFEPTFGIDSLQEVVMELRVSEEERLRLSKALSEIKSATVSSLYKEPNI